MPEKDDSQFNENEVQTNQNELSGDLPVVESDRDRDEKSVPEVDLASGSRDAEEISPSAPATDDGYVEPQDTPTAEEEPPPMDSVPYVESPSGWVQDADTGNAIELDKEAYDSVQVDKPQTFRDADERARVDDTDTIGSANAPVEEYAPTKLDDDTAPYDPGVEQYPTDVGTTKVDSIEPTAQAERVVAPAAAKMPTNNAVDNRIVNKRDAEADEFSYKLLPKSDTQPSQLTRNLAETVVQPAEPRELPASKFDGDMVVGGKNTEAAAFRDAALVPAPAPGKFDGDMVVGGQNAEAAAFRDAALVAAGFTPAPQAALRQPTRDDAAFSTPASTSVDRAVDFPAQMSAAADESDVDQTNAPVAKPVATAVNERTAVTMSPAFAPAPERTAAYESADMGIEIGNVESSARRLAANRSSTRTPGQLHTDRAIGVQDRSMKIAGTAELTINGMPAGELELNLEGTGGA